MLSHRLQPFNTDEVKFFNVYKKYHDDDEYKALTRNNLDKIN